MFKYTLKVIYQKSCVSTTFKYCCKYLLKKNIIVFILYTKQIKQHFKVKTRISKLKENNIFKTTLRFCIVVIISLNIHRAYKNPFFVFKWFYLFTKKYFTKRK